MEPKILCLKLSRFNKLDDFEKELLFGDTKIFLEGYIKKLVFFFSKKSKASYDDYYQEALTTLWGKMSKFKLPKENNFEDEPNSMQKKYKNYIVGYFYINLVDALQVYKINMDTGFNIRPCMIRKFKEDGRYHDSDMLKGVASLNKKAPSGEHEICQMVTDRSNPYLKILKESFWNEVTLILENENSISKNEIEIFFQYVFYKKKIPPIKFQKILGVLKREKDLLEDLIYIIKCSEGAID